MLSPRTVLVCHMPAAPQHQDLTDLPASTWGSGVLPVLNLLAESYGQSLASTSCALTFRRVSTRFLVPTTQPFTMRKSLLTSP